MNTARTFLRPSGFSRTALAGALLFALWALPAAAADRWFHVQVDDQSSGGAEVSVNLPLTLIEKAIKLIPEEVSNDVELELNDAGFSVTDLRELWNEVRDGGDATFLTVREDGNTIEVRKEGDYFVAETVGDGNGVEVNVRFPLQVIDALFSAGPNRLDLAAAIRALANYGDGDMVTVRDGDTNVRVWVDSSNQ